MSPTLLDEDSAESPAPPAAKPPRRQRGGWAKRVQWGWMLPPVTGTALAVLMFWPIVRHPASRIPADVGDPTLQAWQMAWAGHILSRDPGRLWHANAFYPEQYSYAFSDTLLGYAPAGLIGTGPVAAVVRYNCMFIFAFALAFTGVYALVRQLGGGRLAATVSAIGFAYAPWHWNQVGHLHVLSNGGIALSLAMLARGHGFTLRTGFVAGRQRPGWALAGWAAASWQITLGFGIGIPFGYVLGGLVIAVLVWAWRRRPAGSAVPALPQQSALRSEAAPPRKSAVPRQSAVPHQPAGGKEPAPSRRRVFSHRLIRADVAGIVLFALATAAMAYPYLRMIAQHPYARRSIHDVEFGSPPLIGLFTAPGRSELWGRILIDTRVAMSAPVEQTLFPGLTLYALAALGLVFSVWSLRARWWLLGGVVLSAYLSLGTNVPFGQYVGYVLLYRFAPGWDSIRTPGRLTIWTTLLIALLAAGAVTELSRRVGAALRDTPRRPGPVLAAVALGLPVFLVFGEGLHRVDFPVVPPAPATLRTAPDPVMVLPSTQVIDENVMLWSTAGWPRIVNGGSGFTPRRQGELRQALKTFPDEKSLRLLQEIGVRTVIVLKNNTIEPKNRDYARAADPNVDLGTLGIVRTEDADTIRYDLRPSSTGTPVAKVPRAWNAVRPDQAHPGHAR